MLRSAPTAGSRRVSDASYTNSLNSPQFPETIQPFGRSMSSRLVSVVGARHAPATQMGAGLGQSASTLHATQVPAPSQTTPPLSEQAVPWDASVTPQAWAVQVSLLHVVVCGAQSVGLMHCTQALASTTQSMPSVQSALVLHVTQVLPPVLQTSPPVQSALVLHV